MSVITEIVRDVYHNRNWDNVHNFPEDKLCNHKLFHIQSSVGCLEHIINKKRTSQNCVLLIMMKICFIPQKIC